MTLHETSQELLPDFAAGVLTGEQRAELEKHVSACAECREWVETYRLLEATLASTEPHPRAAELARFALLSETDEPLEAHLGSCGDCRREIELGRTAAASARDGAVAQGATDWRAWRSAVSGRRLVLAAAVLLALVATPLLMLQLAGPDPGQEHDLFGTDLADTRTIAAEHSLYASQTAILAGANVTLAASELVAFGEGFSVSRDATLAVEIRSEQLTPSRDAQ